MNTDLKVRQKTILKKVYSTKPFGTKVITGLLPEISTSSDDLVDATLGDFGLKLKNFGLRIDLSHPDLPNAIPFLTNKLFNKFSLANEQTGSHLFRDNLKLISDLWDHIDNPFINGRYIRFLPKRVDRESLRLTKRSQIFDLYKLYNDSEEKTCPNGFQDYYRFANQYSKRIRAARETIERLSETGLSGMLQASKENVLKMFHKNLYDRYYGFNQISLIVAAMILAKMENYTVSKKVKSFINKKSHRRFSPVLKPIHEIKPPEDMVSLIDLLEQYPDVGNKSMFDHYWVLSNNNSDKSISVLLGDRDGKMYFISYWM